MTQLKSGALKCVIGDEGKERENCVPFPPITIVIYARHQEIYVRHLYLFPFLELFVFQTLPIFYLVNSKQ